MSEATSSSVPGMHRGHRVRRRGLMVVVAPGPSSPACGGDAPAARGKEAVGAKEGLVKRLRRIEGQVRGIEKMVEDERYCIDILTQIAAASSVLESVAIKVLDAHVKHCVAAALAAGDIEAAQEKSRELLDAVERFARTR